MAWNGYYKFGTATIANDETTVTLTGADISDIVYAGDTFECAGFMCRIESVTDSTHFELVIPWPGADQVDSGFLITYNSPLRNAYSYVSEKSTQLIAQLSILDNSVAVYSVNDMDVNTPPVSPVEGDKYVVGASPTGLWVGYVGYIAVRTQTSWEMIAPDVGMEVQDISTDPPTPYKRGSSAWYLKSETTSFNDLTDTANVEKAILTAHGDSDWTIPDGTTVAITNAALTAARVWTLPAAASVTAGTKLIVQDTIGGVTSTNTLTVQRTGTDTIDGATSLELSHAYEGATFVSDGDTAWTVSIVSITAGGTGANTLAGIRSNFGIREQLSANRTYYVRTDGSDSNTGLVNSSGGAFLTIQKALAVCAALDLTTYSVTIQVGAGTYTGPVTVNGPWLGSGSVIILGDTTTPSNVVINSVSADCVAVTRGGRLSVRGFKFTNSTAGTCLNASLNGIITVDGAVEFGACSQIHVYTSGFGRILFLANYTVSGAAQAHMSTVNGSIYAAGITVTITGTPAFSNTFAGAERCGILEVYSNTYTGSATGVRYRVSTNGVVFTNGGGSTYLPGDSAGIATTGGQYT